MPTSSSSSQSSRSRGSAAERLVVRHFRLRGYRILDRNAWAGRNELDVVARRGRTLVFCEVKSKGQRHYGDPLEMVGPEKQRRVLRAAEAWLAAHRECAGLEVRLEVAAVRGRRIERVALSPP